MTARGENQTIAQKTTPEGSFYSRAAAVRFVIEAAYTYRYNATDWTSSVVWLAGGIIFLSAGR